MSKIQPSNVLAYAPATRRYLLRRYAERYVLITLLSFAFTVGATRIFLNLTGFPQLGSGTVHISHVLWGGLLLFTAVILLLVFFTQKIFMVSALLGGMGIGLFMDEIGKFITSTYDYFIPIAAPIIYTFFLLIVMVYLLVYRRSRNISQYDLNQLLGDFEEILDGDFAQSDIDQLTDKLSIIKSRPELSDIRPLAIGMEQYLIAHQASGSARPGIYDRIATWWTSFRDRVLPRRRVKSLLIGGLIGLAVWELIYPINFALKLDSPDQMANGFAFLVTGELITGPLTTNLFLLRLSFNLVLGMILATAVILFLLNQESKASSLAYIALLVLLTSENLLLFYFDQFSTIINAVLQCVLLLFVLHYRRRYLMIRI